MSEKIEQFWRDATADDVARVVNGHKLEMRYRESGDDKWSTEKLFLAGYDASDTDGCHWLSNKGDMLSECQVYDLPEWYINKPEPGEGYRLLDKFPPEDKQAGDEWFSYKTKDWVYAGTSKLQRADVWYRRRIDTNNPEIPDSSNSSETPNSCRSCDTIPSGWRVLSKDAKRLASDAYWSQSCKEWLLIGDDRVRYANELDKWHAIRQVVFYDNRELRVNGVYSMPGGQTIRVTAKGFEVVQ